VTQTGTNGVYYVKEKDVDMAMLTYRKNIPEVGDKVASTNMSDDGLVVWVKMESGKTIISHICDDVKDEKLEWTGTNWRRLHDFIQSSDGNMVKYALSPDDILTMETSTGIFTIHIGQFIVKSDGHFSISN